MELINLGVKLPEGEEILLLNYKFIPIMNDNDSLWNHLLSSFIQTPLEKWTAPNFSSCRIVSVARTFNQVWFSAYSCDGLGVRRTPMEPFVSSSMLDFIGLAFVVSSQGISSTRVSGWCLLWAPEYMGLPCSCLYSYNSVWSNPFTLNLFSWKLYNASTSTTNTFVFWPFLLQRKHLRSVGFSWFYW